MAYTVKEIFYSLQGEGFHAGRPAVFCRFSGCNLWNGQASARKAASCQFCDTDFVGTDGKHGGKYSAEKLAQTMKELWPADAKVAPFCVLTGGEPAMQFDSTLKSALHHFSFNIAMETNGTLPLSASPDWLTVSPKGTNPLQLISGNELKLVWPQPMHPIEPESLIDLAFDHFYLQPIDGLSKDYRAECLDYCLAHPQWKLSLQQHKILGIE